MVARHSTPNRRIQVRFARTLGITVFVITLSAPAAFSAGTVAQHTKIGFGGAIGRIANVFGGKAVKEGIDSVSVVKGDRRNHIVGDNGELVDLKEEKIYKIDYARQTYTVTTFDELRKKWEEEQKRAEKESGSAREEKPEKKGPEYVVEVDVKETGKKQVISGFNTHEVIVTTTVHEKGKTLDEAGGAVLTSDLWIGPHVPELAELAKFEQRYAEKLYGHNFAGMDPRALASVIATAPQFTQAMKKFQEKADALDGTPILSELTFESVRDPRAKEDDQEADSSSPSSAAAKMVGGFLARRHKNDADSGSKPETANRAKIFTSTNEITRADHEADAAKLAVPSGFREVK